MEEIEREHEPEEREVMPSHWRDYRSSSCSPKQTSTPLALVSVFATEEVDFEDLTLTVDASSSLLDVLECEPLLPAVDFMASTQRLLDWVPAPKRKKFQVWVQSSTSLIFAGKVPEPLRVHLRPAHTRSSGGVFAQCVMTTSQMQVSGKRVVQIKVRKAQGLGQERASNTAAGSRHVSL